MSATPGQRTYQWPWSPGLASDGTDRCQLSGCAPKTSKGLATMLDPTLLP